MKKISIQWNERELELLNTKCFEFDVKQELSEEQLDIMEEVLEDAITDHIDEYDNLTKLGREYEDLYNKVNEINCKHFL